MMNRQLPVLNLLSPGVGRSLLLSSLGAISLFAATGGSSLLAQTPDAVDAIGVESAPQAPLAPEPPIPAPEVFDPVPSNETYIDSTDYGIGATQRTPEYVAPAVGLSNGEPSAIAPAVSIPVGVVSPASYGVAAIGSTPSLKDFYRRTLRPPGRLGNGNIRLVFPLSIPAPITSLFGWRVHPIFGTPRFHSGTDIGAPIGTPVLAAYAGQVVLADFFGGYGLAVALDHNKGKQQTLYGHLSEVFVKPGDPVKQGTVIGRVGSTGNSTGPHLHFEYRELTADGWVALDAGAQLEYALAELVKAVDVSENGIVAASLQSQKSLAGVSGKIAWKQE